jgi:ElaB/YqjD/DUF883 family membrane-anchored ribosome-binding protein
MTDIKEGVPPAGDAGDPAKLNQIEADIDQTRNAITGDLRTLGERLSPEHLKQEAKEVMTEAKQVAVETLHEAKDVATNTFREVKDSALETVNEKVGELRENVRSVEREAVGFVRDNAIPLAMIGVGVAWFVSNRRSREARWEGQYAPRGDGRWRYPSERSGSHPLDDARDGLSRARYTTREYAQRAGERARGWVGEAEHRVGDAAGRVQDFAQREADQVRGLARDATEKVSDVALRARDLAQRELNEARQFSRQAAETHPLAVGAAAVAAGVVVGLLIPETRRESELLGAQRDRLMSGAKEAVSDAKEVMQDLQQTAKETAKGTARDVKNSLSGLTG